MKNLESLANEILIDLFEYFYGIDLLRAFYGLNSRFNFLLYKQFRTYSIQFNCVSKRYFDMICQQHLPFIADRVTTLRLSDYKETAGQINLFVSSMPSFHQFTHLQSLTLSSLHSYQILLKLLDQFHHLKSLIRLNFFFCSFRNDGVNLQFIVDKIWSLPKLTSCFFGIVIKEQKTFCVPTVISSSLKYVHISRSELKWNEINRFFDYTPCLQHLSISIASFINEDYVASPIPTLTGFTLNFNCESTGRIINVFFRSMPNLRHLDVTIQSEMINGHQWEHIVRSYLPRLKTFRLNMHQSLPFDENMEERADRLIDSFRNPFWITERQWFVRCFTYKTTIHLGTLSQAFDYPESQRLNSWRSTYPHDNLQEVYKNMTTLTDTTFFDQPISTEIRLPNISHLDVKLPINDQFWSIVPNLNRLETLTVSSDTEICQFQLQTLLDRTPHLRKLTISQDELLFLHLSLLIHTNTSIRVLELHKCNHWFNEEECIALSRSLLGVQCEVLSIRVKNRESIINLVKNMVRLRALNVYCNDENNSEHSQLTDNNLDQLAQWLKDRLPSTCMVVNDPHYAFDVSIWI